MDHIGTVVLSCPLIPLSITWEGANIYVANLKCTKYMSYEVTAESCHRGRAAAD